MSDYPPSRMHIKNRAALNEFLDHLERIGLMQFPFTFSYSLLVDEQPNGDKKFFLQIGYRDTKFKEGRPLQIETNNNSLSGHVPVKMFDGTTPQQRLIRNGEMD